MSRNYRFCSDWRLHKLVMLQITQYQRHCLRGSLPEWYETQRKTTHVIFWS